MYSGKDPTQVLKFHLERLNGPVLSAFRTQIKDMLQDMNRHPGSGPPGGVERIVQEIYRILTKHPNSEEKIREIQNEI